MGQADFLKLGDYNISCFICSRKCKASQARKHWQGFLVCDAPGCWEPRQPQDYAGKAVGDNIVPIQTQPEPADVFLGVVPYFPPYDPTA